MKKKSKRKLKRRNVKISNMSIDNEIDMLDEFEDEYKFSKQNKKINKIENNFSARVLEVFSNNRAKLFYDGKTKKSYIKGNLKQFESESHNLLAVGDYVQCTYENHKPVIVAIDNRINALMRIINDKKIVIAANIDQVIITTSYQEPELNLGLVDRFICSAKLMKIKPIICVNKIDKCEDISSLKNRLKFYKRDGIDTIFTSAQTESNLENLKKILIDKDSVFAGLSGVGKSSLINRLQPGIQLQTAEISSYSNKGTHTTTSSKMIPWQFGGYLIDTPGIKVFGLRKDDKDRIKNIFPNFEKYRCKFNDCSHTHEHECGVKKAVEANEIPIERYESYLRIIESLEGI